MATLSMTGAGTLVLFDTVINDLANADAFVIAYENDLTSTTTGKNGNTIHAKNEQGRNAICTVRVMKGSTSDRLLQGKLNEMNQSFSSFVAASGRATGDFGDGLGNVVKEVYDLTSGVFTKNVDGRNNVEGDTEQAVAIYTIRFADVERSMQ